MSVATTTDLLAHAAPCALGLIFISSSWVSCGIRMSAYFERGIGGVDTQTVDLRPMLMTRV